MDERAEIKPTSFMQYRLCEICKVNHKRGGKHARYSKKHKEILDSIIEKYANKIVQARKDIALLAARKAVKEEVTETFWCYFCACEIPKHLKIESAVVENMELLFHLASMRHKQKTVDFWKENFIEKTKMHPFIILEEEVIKLKELANQKIVELERQQEQILAQETERMRHELERRRRVVIMTTRPPLIGGLQPKQVGLQTSLKGTTIGPPVGRVRTLTASGEGLTFIGAPHLADAVGNVYTCATPPWLQSDEDGGKTDSIQRSSLIGPNEDDFLKHLERQKKRKLPATRVGANFDHLTATRDDWLPSFGRTWSKNTRTHQQNFSMKSIYKDRGLQHRFKHITSSTTSSSVSAAQPSASDESSSLRTDDESELLKDGFIEKTQDLNSCASNKTDGLPVLDGIHNTMDNFVKPHVPYQQQLQYGQPYCSVDTMRQTNANIKPNHSTREPYGHSGAFVVENLGTVNHSFSAIIMPLPDFSIPPPSLNITQTSRTFTSVAGNFDNTMGERFSLSAHNLVNSDRINYSYDSVNNSSSDSHNPHNYLCSSRSSEIHSVEHPKRAGFGSTSVQEQVTSYGAVEFASSSAGTSLLVEPPAPSLLPGAYQRKKPITSAAAGRTPDERIKISSNLL